MRDISMEEAEVGSTQQHSSIVQRAAVVQLVERHDIVRIRILADKVTNKP